MTDPKRLFEDGSAFERSLLASGRDEDPSRDLESKILAALAAVPATAAPDLPQSPAGGPAASHPSLFRLTAPRGLAMAAAVLGLGAVIAASSMNEGGRHEAPAAPAPVPTVVAAAPPAPVVEQVAVVTPESLPTAPAVVPSARATAIAPVRGPAAEQAGSIEREIELLDAVKSKLGAGSAAEASRALDTYDAEFPRGTLRPERTVLRIRTLLLQGNRPAARAMADEFLGTHPGSVHEKRIKALLAD